MSLIRGNNTPLIFRFLNQYTWKKRQGEAIRRESELNASQTQLPWKKMDSRPYWEAGRLPVSFCCFLQVFTDRPPKIKNLFSTATGREGAQCTSFPSINYSLIASKNRVKANSIGLTTEDAFFDVPGSEFEHPLKSKSWTVIGKEVTSKMSRLIIESLFAAAGIPAGGKDVMRYSMQDVQFQFEVTGLG